MARSLQLPDSGFHVKRSSREMISCVCRSADPAMHMLNELIVGHDAARNGNGPRPLLDPFFYPIWPQPEVGHSSEVDAFVVIMGT